MFEWPKSNHCEETELSIAMEEKVINAPDIVHAMVSKKDEIEYSVLSIIDIKRFSSKARLLKTFALMLQFVNNLKAAVKKAKSIHEQTVIVEEIERSEVM